MLRIQTNSVLLLAVLMLALGTLLLAAAPTKPPTITITKTDNSAVRGQLTTVDPKSLTVTPLVKGQPEGTPVVVAWTDIKSVSNGLTQKRVIEQWKKEHPDDRCDTCHGTGKTACPTCHGTGRDHDAAKECPTCHGAQTVACTTPKEDQGKIPCPKPHLKLSEGVWVKRDDGKRWRTFPSRTGGSFSVSDGHLGQIVEIVDGVPQSPVVCPLCNGAMTIEDPKCHGTGQMPCNTCAMRAAAEKCKDCERGSVACTTCNGTGLKSMATAKP